MWSALPLEAFTNDYYAYILTPEEIEAAVIRILDCEDLDPEWEEE